MIPLVVVLCVAGFFLWRLRRRAVKRSMVAGLVPERPAFMVEPPPGRMGRMKDGLL